MPWTCFVLRVVDLVGDHSHVPRRDQRRSPLRTDLGRGARLDAGLDADSLDVIGVLIEPIAARGQYPAADPAKSRGVGQVRTGRQGLCQTSRATTPSLPGWMIKSGTSFGSYSKGE